MNRLTLFCLWSLYAARGSSTAFDLYFFGLFADAADQ